MTQNFIDCEHHLAVPALADLLPYMEESWAARFRRSAFSLPTAREHPGGGALEQGAGPPSPDVAAARLPPEVRAALLLPQQALPVAGWSDTLLCSVYVSALNRYVREHWLPASERFRMAIAVSPHEPELAVDEIERHADEPGTVAVFMPLLAQHMGQSFYRPILAAAARHRLPVMIHPSGREGTIVGTPVLSGMGPRHPGEYHALIWQVAATNIASLVYDGVFVDLPDLQVVFVGFGFEWLPNIVWHADMEWRNLRIDIPWVVDPPSAYMGRHIRVVVDDLGATPSEAASKIAALLPPGMLLWGSNTPFVTNSGAEILAAMPEALRDGVARANAEAAFGARLFAGALT